VGGLRPRRAGLVPGHAYPGYRGKIVLEQNVSLEAGLTGAIMTGLSDKDHEVYRQPFPTPPSRRPLLEWPRSVPLDGDPADVVSRVEAYDKWLAIRSWKTSPQRSPAGPPRTTSANQIQPAARRIVLAECCPGRERQPRWHPVLS
jgi:hypothetical protein